ncbi:MAG: LPS export ABC transporter periplasmic protein LptC [Capnocytophaga sp.]|nr:LPS export ABC transporter periplasmic protein LptC [Capnocytophaga sp.]
MNRFKKLLINIAALMSVALFFSCNDEIRTIKQIETHKFPTGEARDFQLIYTDSTKIKAILESPLNLDFTNQQFAYMEFPEGLKITFFDNQKNKNIIQSNYAVYYLPTQIVELRDSVRLTTYDGKLLKTSQLFWQESSDWAFTEKPFTYIDTLQGSITKGIGMDFDKSFSKLKAHKITGILPLKE